MRILKKELWPYAVGTRKSCTISMENWLGSNIGPIKERWNVVYNYGETVYYFRHEQDAAYFSLKWV